MSEVHIPVLLNEVIKGLNIKKDGVYIDMKVWYFRDSKKIAEMLSEKGTLLCLDKDQSSISYVQDKIKKDNLKPKVIIRKSDFKDVKKILNEEGIKKADGILFDLGVSSLQIDNAKRGFSYMNDGKLDMRMDQDNEFSAFELINEYDQNELIRIFREYGEEKFSSIIAENIIKRRTEKKIKGKKIRTTKELLEIIEEVIPKKFQEKGFKNAKRIFQAIRIEVNNEIENLKESLETANSLLNKNGRLVVISFHSLEDKIVKKFLIEKENPCVCPKNIPYCVCGRKPELKRINRKVIKPSKEELKMNHRASSAKLRIMEKINGEKEKINEEYKWGING